MALADRIPTEWRQVPHEAPGNEFEFRCLTGRQLDEARAQKLAQGGESLRAVSGVPPKPATACSASSVSPP